MSKSKKRKPQGNPEVERELSQNKKLTDQEIKDNLPQVWKDRAAIGSTQIAIPIPGSRHHS